MKKKIIIVIIIVIVFILLGLGFYALIKSVKEDQQLTTETMNEIIKSYDDFNKSVQTFVTTRAQFYEYRENTYLEEFAQNYQGWNEFMPTYARTIENVEKSSQVLKENCQIQFADPNVNSRCTTFKADYEAAMNYYIADIVTYNQNVDEYNQWNQEGNYNYGVLNKAQLHVYQDYIDFDKDGEYFGKGETTNE